MVSRLFLALLSALLVGSCAQVGQLSGGELDRKAPTIIQNESDTSGQINFSRQAIKLVFDEYVQLVEADQRIQLIPNDAELQATLKHKTLQISWKDSLVKNTTYVISMNHAVKDLTEGNDSLMQIVFSTGPTIDSLHYTCTVLDAKSMKPLAGVLVGLFPDEKAVKPTYFTMTNANGVARLNYLKSGSYWVRGAQDANKDLTIQDSERQGFKPKQLTLNTSIDDSIPISLYTPKPQKLISDFLFASPGLFVLKTNLTTSPETIELNGKLLGDKQVIKHQQDSLSLIPGLIEQDVFQLVITYQGVSDTLIKSFLKSEREIKNALRLNDNQERLLPNEPLTLVCNDQIASIDFNKISLTNERDSIEIPLKIETQRNQLTINFNRVGLSKVKLHIPQDAIQFVNQPLLATFDNHIELIQEEETGSILIKPIEINGKKLILEVYQEGKFLFCIPFNQQHRLALNNLLPGNYAFACFEDSNENAVWDVGNWKTKTAPETRWIFPSSFRVRANWESEITLTTP